VAGLMQAWTLNFVYDKTMVQIQFSVGGLAGSEGEISRRMAAFQPLFMLMANSIVFPNKLNTALPRPVMFRFRHHQQAIITEIY
jgi:hypothetical protein